MTDDFNEPEPLELEDQVDLAEAVDALHGDAWTVGEEAGSLSSVEPLDVKAPGLDRFIVSRNGDQLQLWLQPRPRRHLIGTFSTMSAVVSAMTLENDTRWEWRGSVEGALGT